MSTKNNMRLWMIHSWRRPRAFTYVAATALSNTKFTIHVICTVRCGRNVYEREGKSPPLFFHHAVCSSLATTQQRQREKIHCGYLVHSSTSRSEDTGDRSSRYFTHYQEFNKYKTNPLYLTIYTVKSRYTQSYKESIHIIPKKS
jgi:hypothetical protein